MNLTALFKSVNIVIVIIFALFISDWRKKQGMVPLISRKLTSLIKFLYIFPILIYLYVLLRIDSLNIYDFMSIMLDFIGVFLVVKAKSDLGKQHTWAGFRLNKTKLISKGIYSYIRHPLYTGIFLFIFGGIFIILGHGSKILIILSLISSAIIISFLLYAAGKETEILEKEFGKEFLNYKRRVGAFFPKI